MQRLHIHPVMTLALLLAASAPVKAAPPEAQPNPVVAFDTGSIPVSNKDLGEFPFLTPPEGYKYGNKGKFKEFHRTYYVVGEGSLFPVEGKNFSSTISKEKGVEYSKLLVERNYENAITSLGGVKVFDGLSNPKKMRAFLDNKQEVEYRPGDLWNARSWQTYVIRKPDAEIWIGLSCNSSHCTYSLTRKEAMAQTIKVIPASKIKAALDKDGQIALYIHFDVDKSTIKPESVPIVDEIVKLLDSNPGLKIRIEGHTDNTGETAHNQTLSENRAAAVYGALLAKGIAANRLASKGYGASRPIASNDTEEGRAQNRRVVIVKTS